MLMNERSIPAFQATSYASLQILRLLASELNSDRAELAFSIGDDADKYFDELDQLSLDILDAENRARIGRYGLEILTAIPPKAAAIGSVMAPTPASFLLWATQTKIDYAKLVVLNQIDRSIQITSNALATYAVKALVERTGKTIDNLFSAVPSEVAEENIHKAAQELVDGYGDISDSGQQILVGAAVSSMRKLVQDGSESASPRIMTKEEATDAVKKIVLAKQTTSTLIENEKNLSEAGVALTEKQYSSEVELKEKGNLSKESKKSLIGAAETVIKYAKLSKEVVDAAEALGLDSKTGAAINRVSGVVQGAATAAIGVATANPMAIISGVASFISSVFGKKKKGPNLDAHLNRILDKLSEIDESVSQIKATQLKILEQQRVISLNQIKLAEISGDIVREIQKNREFLVEIAYGPIKLFEEELLKAGLLGALGGGYSNELSYQDYYETFWNFDGDRTIQALNQLEMLFGKRGFINPVLRASSYLTAIEVKLEGSKDPDTLFQLAVGKGPDQTQLFKQRLGRLAEIATPRAAVSEGYSIGQMLFQGYDLPVNLSEIKELDTELIDPGTLIRLARIALASSPLNELLFVDERGIRRIMSLEELVTHNTSDRGFELLEVVLELLDIALGQQLVLSDKYYELEFLMSALRGHKTVEGEMKYLDSDPGLKRFWAIAMAYASLNNTDRLYDRQWMDEYQVDLALFILDNPNFSLPAHSKDIAERGEWAPSEYSNWEVITESTIEAIRRRLPGKMHQVIDFRVETRDVYFNVTPMNLSEISYIQVDLLGYHFPVLGEEGVSSLDRYCGVWSRAEKNGGILAYLSRKGDQLPYDDIRKYFEPGSPYNLEDEDRPQYLNWESFNGGGYAPPPSWSEWDMRKMEASNVLADSVDLREFELFRTSEDGRFDPMIEQLINLKADIQRGLLTYHMQRDGKHLLRERLVKAILPLEVG